MLTTWPTHEEAVPKMPCGRRKLNASCKRTRYRSHFLFAQHLEAMNVLAIRYFFLMLETEELIYKIGSHHILREASEL